MCLMLNPLQPFCYNSLGDLMCFCQTLSKIQVRTHYRHFASCFVTLPQTITQGHFTVPSLTDSFYKQVSLDRKHFMTKPMSAARQLQLRFDKILTFFAILLKHHFTRHLTGKIVRKLASSYCQVSLLVTRWSQFIWHCILPNSLLSTHEKPTSLTWPLPLLTFTLDVHPQTNFLATETFCSISVTGFSAGFAVFCVESTTGS